MPYDAHATRERLLAAAVDEFAAWGLAGGRVDRIAAAADANKRAIYDYFGDKEGLFDAAVGRVVDDLNEANPVPEWDVAGYAGRLFDYLHAHPAAVRLTAWWRLERPQVTAGLRPEWAARLQDADDRALDTLILVIGLANAWFLSAEELLRVAGGDPRAEGRLAAHRAAVVAAARRLSDRTGPGAA